MSDAGKRDITQLLNDWRAGREEALHELIPIIYAELNGRVPLRGAPSFLLR